MTKRLLAILATFALLIACAVLTVSANTDQTPTLANTTPVAFDPDTMDCPHCDTRVPSSQWTEMTASTTMASGHYKITDPNGLQLTGMKQLGVGSAAIWINTTVTAKTNTNAFRVGNGDTTVATMWLLGGENGVITGTGAAATASSSGEAGRTTENGGLMRVFADGTLYIDGALTIRLSGDVTTGMAGLMDIFNGKVIMSDGTLYGVNNSASGVKDAAGNAADTYGAILLRGAGSFVMEGGRIVGGNSTYAGAIWVNSANASATIKGDAYIEGGNTTEGGAIYVNKGSATVTGKAYIKGGISSKGGAVMVAASGSFAMTGGTIAGCTITDTTETTVNGGAIYSAATGANAVQLNGGKIIGGTVARAADSSKNITALKGRGGAIYVNAGVLNLGGVNITGGKAHEGGFLYLNSGTVNMTAGSVSGADGLANGGTAFLKGTMNMSGGTITANPNNTYTHSKGIRVVGGAALNLSGDAKVISTGTNEGSGVYVVNTGKTTKATVSLADNATVCNPSGTQINNIFLSNYNQYPSQIIVNEGWEGTASVKFGYIYSSEYAAPGAAYSIGMQIPAAYAVVAGDYDGKLYMESAAQNPTLWWDGATGMHASDVQVYTTDGFYWAKDNATAAKESSGGYIKLLNTKPLDLNGKEVYVDFNGNSATVTLNGGKLYGMDSTATNQAPGASRVTVTDGAAEFYAVNPVNGQCAFARTVDGTTVFHAVKVTINSANLRPDTLGVYYGAKFLCDETLASYVETFGIAVSLASMPDTNFATDRSVLYTANSKELFGTETCNSVIINQIMGANKTPQINQKYAEMPIYANAYMVLNIEGQKVTVMAETTAQLSLKDVIKQVDKRWHSLEASQKTDMISKVYDPYVTQFTGNGWSLTNLENAKADGNRELKVLTIGNSLSVDATRMLAYIAQQEGSVGFKVGTLYKANCSVQEHADFLTNDKPNYWYYESGFDVGETGTLTAGSLVPSETKNYVGYDALVAEDWDVIIMQHSVFGSAKADTYDASIDTIIDYVNANKTNPDAIFVWNMTWMGPVDDELLATASSSSPGFDKSYISYTKDPLDRQAQTMMYEQISGAVEQKIYTDERFAYILPSATMMQNALTATSDKVMYRDYIHGSDYGRLMNAYLWYSMITGKTITDPKVDSIPGELRFLAANRTENLTLSQRMENILVESVSNAIKNPFTETVSKYRKEDSLKVLAIGNSFSVDALWHLEEVARSEGYMDVKIATLFIGGCTLKTHWAKAEGDLAAYTYYYNYDGNWKETANFKISQALLEQDWDVITLQQASGGSGQASTYEPYLENMINYLQTNAPKAKILWHMTWAYAQSSTHESFPNYGSDQMTMYNAITGAVQTAVAPYMTSGDIAGLIPSGTTIQNVRTSHLGDTLNRDGYHLNITGRVIAACTWYSVLTGNEMDEFSAFYFKDDYIGGKVVTLTDKDRAMIVECVNNAIDTPFQVTNSAYTK